VREFPVKDLEMSPSTRQQTDTNHLMTNKQEPFNNCRHNHITANHKRTVSFNRYAGNTRSRTRYQKWAQETCMKNLTQVYNSFLHQDNSPTNHAAQFVSRAGQFLCWNRAVFYCM